MLSHKSVAQNWSKVLTSIRQFWIHRSPQFTAKIKAFLSNVPVIGHLMKCSFANHSDAVKEFVPSIAFSTATFWLSAVFLMALKANAGSTFGELLEQNLESGELLIFSLAFLGSIIVSAAEDPDKARTFPGRAWHFFVVFGVAVVASGFYALIKVAKEIPNKGFLDDRFVLAASLLIAAIALVLAYLTLVYRKQTFDPESELKDPENLFADQFNQSLKP